MSHIEILIMNKVRNTLEDLERSGVGYIYFENTGSIKYIIDDKEIVVKVEEFPKLNDPPKMVHHSTQGE